MSIRITLLATACMLAVSACGDRSTPAAQDTTAPAAAPVDSTAAPADTSASATGTTAPVTDTATPAPGSAAAPAGKPAATVTDCATTITGNDAMQFDVGSITVPASCSQFTINLTHVGKLPVAAMGHNVVITKASDMQAVAADGMAAGAGASYVKPDDPRVIAHSDLVGGGQSTSVSFDVSKIKDGGPYEFFCSFPGHAAVMKGTIGVG
jgi:azurin